jgi:predicted DNA-binding protein (UPF0251 family)
MRLSDYLDRLCWSQADAARKAEVSTQSISRALAGAKVSRKTANALVEAIGAGMGRKLLLSDIEGLNVVTLRRRKRSKETKQPAERVKRSSKQEEK